jgi:DNA-binding NarL/FixJ family response regulator
MTAAMKIMLVDDHEVVRRGMRAILEGYAGLEIVGEAGDGRSAVQMALDHEPDVIVMDVGMRELNGFEATRRILKLLPKTEVLILTMHDGEQLVRDVIEAGAWLRDEGRRRKTTARSRAIARPAPALLHLRDRRESL